MDAFWCITLSVIVISIFFKRERRRKKEDKIEAIKERNKVEEDKQRAVIEKYSPVFAAPETLEERKARLAAEEAKKQKDKDIEYLRKQGFTDELIATIIPTINNGQ